MAQQPAQPEPAHAIDTQRILELVARFGAAAPLILQLLQRLSDVFNASAASAPAGAAGATRPPTHHLDRASEHLVAALAEVLRAREHSK